MSDRTNILERIRKSVIEGDAKRAAELAKKALNEGIDPLAAIDVLTKGVREVGEKFGRHEIFLTELIMAGNAMKAACDVLKEAMPKNVQKSVGRVLIGSVSGDLHSIGKDIVATMLEAGGFEVYNLGEDVPTEVFVEKVKTLKPDILALSTLMTTTMPQAEEVIKALEKANLRNDVRIIVGGAPTTREWAREIGADGWAEDAVTAVEVAKSLLKRNTSISH